MIEPSEAATRRIVRAAVSRGTDRSALWVAGAGLVSLALYRILASLGDWREHLTGYLLVHGALFVAYAGIVALLTWKVFTLPPWTTGRTSPPLMIARRDHDLPAGEPVNTPTAPGAESARARPVEGVVPAPEAPEMAPDDGSAGELPWPPPRPVGRVTPLLLMTFAVAFRVTLLFVPASLSHDVHRAVRDGGVLAGASSVDPLAPLRGAAGTRIEEPSKPTDAAPLSAAVFFVAARAGLGEIGFKGLFVLFDLAIVAALAFLLRRTGRPMSWAALYAWNPLVVLEIAGSGHAEPIGLLFLVLAAFFIAGERRFLGIGAYAFCLLGRWLPLAYLPIVVRRFKAPHLLVGAAIVVAGWLVTPGAGAAASARLANLAASGGDNVVVFPVVRAAVETFLPAETLQGAARRLDASLEDPARQGSLPSTTASGLVALGVLALVLIGGTIAISLDVLEITAELLCATALVLVLAPRVDPWHALWIVPFAVTEASLPGLLFTGLVPLAYLSFRAPGGVVPTWALALEWGAPAALALALGLRKRTVARRIRALAARG